MFLNRVQTIRPRVPKTRVMILFDDVGLGMDGMAERTQTANMLSVAFVRGTVTPKEFVISLDTIC